MGVQDLDQLHRTLLQPRGDRTEVTRQAWAQTLDRRQGQDGQSPVTFVCHCPALHERLLGPGQRVRGKQRGASPAHRGGGSKAEKRLGMEPGHSRRRRRRRDVGVGGAQGLARWVVLGHEHLLSQRGRALLTGVVERAGCCRLAPALPQLLPGRHGRRRHIARDLVLQLWGGGDLVATLKADDGVHRLAPLLGLPLWGGGDEQPAGSDLQGHVGRRRRHRGKPVTHLRRQARYGMEAVLPHEQVTEQPAHSRPQRRWQARLGQGAAVRRHEGLGDGRQQAHLNGLVQDDAVAHQVAHRR